MHALQVLEYSTVLDLLAKRCENPLGRDAASNLQPSFDEEAVWESLDVTAEAYALLGTDSPPSLARVLAQPGTLLRAEKGGTLGAKELYDVGETLRSLRTMKQFLSQRADKCPRLAAMAEPFPTAPIIENAILDAVEPDGEVKDSASSELASLRKRKAAMGGRILERVQSYISGKSREYLSDPLYTVRDGRYVLPVKSEHRAKIKGIVHDTSGSGQTVYVEPEDVLNLGNQLREIEGAEREEIARILRSLSEMVATVALEARVALGGAGTLDLTLAKARLGYDMRATNPVRRQSASLKLQGARHPLLDPEIVVPIDIEVGREFVGLLITGPNTGGKTVAIKCAGLAVLMAQSGLMIAARDAEFGPFTQIWADIGDEQSIAQSLSTFSGHLRNIAAALGSVQEGALVLFDEIGAGTDPAEGASLARALLRRFARAGARIIASTHYGELKAFAFSEPGFKNAAMEFDAKSLRPTYRLLVGAPGASHALRIAERYGIPTDVLEEANAELGQQHHDLADMLLQLETSQKQARQAQSQADRKLEELRKLEAAANRKLAEAEESKRTAHQKAMDLVDESLREIRLQVMDALDSLKTAATPLQIQEAKEQLREVQNKANEATQHVSRQAPTRTQVGTPLAKGVAVRVDGYSQHGVLLDDIKDGQAYVQIGPLKLRIAERKVTPVGEPVTAPAPRVKTTAQSLQRAQAAAIELNIRGWRAEEAQEALERFVDDALMGNLHQIRVLHGKGEGILRKMTQDYLRRQKGVKRVRDGEPAEGGSGVTVADLK